MNGFEKRRAQKKERILQSLKDMITERNFQDIGVREIAQHAGVSPASIYNFFGNKEELAKQVVYHMMDEAGASFRSMMAEDIPFEEKFEKLYQITVTKQDTWKSDGMKNVFFGDPAVQAHMERYTATVTVPALLQLIEQGKAEGKISTSVSAESVVFLLSAIAAMFGNPAVRDKMSIQQRKEIAHLFFYGLFGLKPVF